MKKEDNGLISGYCLWLDSISSRDLVLAAVGEDGEILSQKNIVNGSRSEHFLPAVERFVDSRGSLPRAIAVVQGAGSFSQVRLACTVANALGYGWGVPVVVSVETRDVWRLIKKAPRHSLALPQYQGPAVG